MIFSWWNMRWIPVSSVRFACSKRSVGFVMALLFAVLSGAAFGNENPANTAPSVHVDRKDNSQQEQKVPGAQKSPRKTIIDLRREGDRFLKENAGKAGVVVLPSGVQYKVLREGAGPKPTMKDTVQVMYRVLDVTGREVGSTYPTKTSRSVSMASAIPGLQEALLLMNQGAQWQIVLPMATAASNREPMDDLGVLTYELELVSVEPGNKGGT